MVYQQDVALSREGNLGLFLLPLWESDALRKVHSTVESCMGQRMRLSVMAEAYFCGSTVQLQ